MKSIYVKSQVFQYFFFKLQVTFQFQVNPTPCTSSQITCSQSLIKTGINLNMAREERGGGTGSMRQPHFEISNADRTLFLTFFIKIGKQMVQF